MKPLIGITMDHLPSRFDWGAKMFGQNCQYSDAVLAAGGLPVLLPDVDDRKKLRALYEKLDGILFSGGGDILPQLYGEEAGPIIKDPSHERDTMERQLMLWAIEDDKPVLAICRGIQMLNVALGGTLIQDIPSMIENAQNHDISTERKDRHYIAHQLNPTSTSRLGTIIGTEPIGANTHHHQAIKRIAHQLDATAWAEDGIVEAVELPRTRFVIGIQCHPESLTQIEPRWAKLFKEFVKSSSYDIAYFPAAIERSASKTDAPAAVVDAL